MPRTKKEAAKETAEAAVEKVKAVAEEAKSAVKNAAEIVTEKAEETVEKAKAAVEKPRRAVKKAAAKVKKEEIETKVVIELSNVSESADSLIERAKADWTAKGNALADMKQLTLYINAAEGMVYYVVNDDYLSGNFAV